jgi:hypothetical protein
LLRLFLNDGTKTSEVEQSLLSLKSSLGAEGIDFDPRVAAEWSLESIEYAGICRAESGGIRLAESFRAELFAGSARQAVNVEVTFAALEEFQARLGTKRPNKFGQVNSLVREILRDEIKEWLSRGGESRWNPVANNIVQLNYLPLQNHSA